MEAGIILKDVQIFVFLIPSADVESVETDEREAGSLK